MSYQRCVWLAGILVLGLGMVACSSSTAHSSTVHTGPTPNVSATQTVQAELNGPVTVQVKIIKQSGSLAAQNIILTIQVIVINQTAKPIWLYPADCQQPEIALSLANQQRGSKDILLNPREDSCIIPGTEDLSQNDGPGIAAGESISQQFTMYPCDVSSGWKTGNYTLMALLAWHQGTINQANTPTSDFSSGVALGQTTVALA